MNCLTARRRCPYLDGHDAAASGGTTPSTLSETTNASPPGQGFAPNSDAPPFTLLKVENQGQALLEVELLQQWLTSTSCTCLGQNSRATFFAATAMNTGLRYPLVMHSLLAFSALHLSWTNPERRALLLQDVKHFEEQGLVAFKKLDLGADSKFVIPCLLFSFITGVHRPCYVLAYCCTDFDSFLIFFTECISLLRGVSVVIAGHMDIVRNSELGPLLIAPNNPPSTTKRLSDLKAIDKLKKICDPTMSSTENAEVLMHAIDGLRTLYEELDDGSDYGIGSVTVWMMKTPFGLLQMLNEHSPPALIVLAHTAPLLHRRRKCWAVGNSATFLVDSVGEQIPTEWQRWLEWPRQAMT